MKHPNGTIYTYVPGGVRILYQCGTKRFIKNKWYDIWENKEWVCEMAKLGFTIEEIKK